MKPAHYDWINLAIQAVKSTGLVDYDIEVFDHMDDFGFKIRWRQDDKN